jgi:hypothetical protein
MAGNSEHVMTPGLHKMCNISRLVEQLAATRDRLCSIVLDI